MIKARNAVTALLVMSVFSGCAAISQINNARAAYQGVQTYNTAKGMMGAEPAFENASAFSVSAKLMPRDEETADEVKQSFNQLVIEQTQATANELGLELAYCEAACPGDAIKVQFTEKGREGLAQRFAMGDKIGGDLYLLQNGGIIEQYTLDMSEDYAMMAATLTAAINVRLMKTAQKKLETEHKAGRISEKEMKQRSQAIVDMMNEQTDLKGPLVEFLTDKT